ncbi:1608_t:CDS:2, partial [Racocetra persica]
AEILKLDQKYSVTDTIALKRYYLWNLYSKDMDIEYWNNLCNKKFVESFGLPEPRKHFLQLSYFRKQGYDEESVKVIRELFQILGFTGIDDRHILSSNISCAKIISDLNLAIRAINAIVGNWCSYTPYDGLGFGDNGTPELLLYRPKTDNDIQELFDSMRQEK